MQKKLALITQMVKWNAVVAVINAGLKSDRMEFQKAFPVKLFLAAQGNLFKKVLVNLYQTSPTQPSG